MTLKVAGIHLTYAQGRQLGSFVEGEPLEAGPAFDVFYDEAKKFKAEILPVDAMYFPLDIIMHGTLQ
ncbi:hypothetical protein BJ138DRAFT_1113043 [Hygrophoropsis aurantiaca]|uniref:Uncharacterized protein n=1 Tax=Hygrophoropsis aurantiaca TaxID=72124 RepID=A0ACB8AED1_9AGAM|nr:hypothetical protein BJ138DRAFT_1113043 [Hygrophoropsis aurantiaca]